PSHVYNLRLHDALPISTTIAGQDGSMPFILVADDRPLNRHFLMTLLTYYGHQVGEAADCVEALHAARERRPDLIIADVVMPRMEDRKSTRLNSSHLGIS